MDKFVAGLIALGLALPGVASGPRVKPRADLNIREMVSVESRGFVFRAFKGYDEIYPFIVVEKVQPSLTEGDEPVLLTSWRGQEMKGGAVLAETSEGDDFTDLRWNGEVLEFTFRKHTGKLACTVSGVAIGKPAVSCRPATP